MKTAGAKATGMSRRSLLSRILSWGVSVLIGSPAISRAASRPPKQAWDFRGADLDWQQLEMATGDTPLIAAQVRGLPVRALLDSGSGATVISTTLAEKIGLGRGEKALVGGLSDKAAVQLVRDVDVQLAHVTRRLPFVIVADLASASAGFGRPIDMLLGVDAFTDNCVALDFANSRFSVAKSESFQGGQDWKAVALEHGPKQELFIRASVAGLPPVPLMIDLGSSTALMLSTAYARDQGLLKGRLMSTAAIGGLDGIRTNDALTIPDINIQGLRVSSIPSLGMREWFVTSTVGNIGLPLLAQFDVVFDVSAGFVWLRPVNPAHRLPMLKDRSGLGFAASPVGLTIVHVATNSPAQRAGWVAGDRIAAVNGHPVDANYTHGELWRWRFAPATTVVKLTMATGTVRDLTLSDYY